MLKLPKRILDKCTSVNSGCIIWNGYKNKGGYGISSYMGKVMSTHRISWTAHFGKIPEGLLVCHKCDVRNCINPDHLFLGTHKDNMDDCVSKGRDKAFRLSGERHGMAKITEKDVLFIRLQMSRNRSLGFSLANRFSVPYTHILRIAYGESWKCCGGPTIKPKYRRFRSDEVDCIRKLSSKGWRNKEIAEKYNADPSTISKIVRLKVH